MQAGFRPGEGYFEDIADLIALAAKILYSRVLNWIKHFRKKAYGSTAGVHCQNCPEFTSLTSQICPGKGQGR